MKYIKQRFKKVIIIKYIKKRFIIKYLLLEFIV